MIYVKWAALIVPSFFMAILGRILAPILPLFADCEGWQWKKVVRDGRVIAFQLYGVQQYRFWPQKCLRVNVGWKLFDFDDGVTDQVVQWTCMANPLFGTNVNEYKE